MMHSTLASSTVSTYVVDSWPLIERFLRTWSHPLFEGLLGSTGPGSTRLLLSEVNLGEVYYLVSKERGESVAKQVMRIIEELAIEVIPVQAGDVLRAASLKAVYPISYADCFCADLSIQRNAPVLTGDKDFLELQTAGVLTVEWLGA